MEFTRPRGTRDFLFDEMRERKKAESILRNVFENYAYQEIKTPLFEELKLFTTKSGEEIVDQLYNFKDKSDRELTLRPEITAPVARLYLNELQKTASKPIKLYYYGSCFRYERPQKGRFRQFWQFGCELIGAKSPQGEAEVIAMCSESIEKLGIPGADVNINHLGIIRGLFKHFNIDTATQREVMVVIDKGDKDLLKESLTGENPIIDNEELNHVLFKLIDMVGDKSIIKDIEELVAPYPESHDALNELEELIDTLASFNSRTCIRTTCVKGRNMTNPEKYAELIKKASPDFVEIKAYMCVGSSRHRLTPDNMPTFDEVKSFAQKIGENCGKKIVNESEVSRVVLLQ